MNMHSPRFVGRARTRDNFMTFDAARTHDARGNHMGRGLTGAGGQLMRFDASAFFVQDAQGNPTRYRMADGQWSDSRTYDSTGALLVGELERLDMTMHMPLAAVSWGRDIDLREDVTIADDASSFTLTTFASAGGAGTGNGIGNGKAWAGRNTDQVSGVGVDLAKTPHPLRPWMLELKYTIFELESAARLGRPIDQQKYEALQLKYQMDVDEQVYYGDTSTGDTGLVNAALVTNVNNVPNGASGFSTWANKSPDEILADFNTALTSVWAAAAWAVMPGRVLLPPAQFGFISTAKVSNAGNISILKYILENNLLTTTRGAALEIFPLKWCIGAGQGGTIGTTGTVDRMVVYTKDKQRVRFPLTMLQRTPVQYDSIYHKTTYFGRLGVVEVVYPETLGYFDGI